MRSVQRVFIRLFCVLFSVVLSTSGNAQNMDQDSQRVASGLTITDVLGRVVELPAEVTGVILGESRFLPAVSIVNGDNPGNNIKAMVDDLKKFDPGTWQSYLSRYPDLDEIPTIGASSAETFSTEKAISLGANVAIFGIQGHGPGARDREIIKRLEAAGIKIVFIDFRHAPLKNTLLSVALLGEVFGGQEAARQFAGFYERGMAKVRQGLLQVSEESNRHQPTVFIHSRVGLREECCESMADTMIGQLVKAAGGINVATEILPGSTGVISPEHLLIQQPDIYLATAIGSARTVAESSMISLGVGVKPGLTENTFNNALNRYRLQHLNAVKKHQAFTLWHHFYNSPANVVAIQQLAKWFYPEVFKGLDPNQTLLNFYQKFQRVPLEGMYWYQLGSVTPDKG